MNQPTHRTVARPRDAATRRRPPAATVPAPPELCPRCRGSFVMTQVRDGRLSVECPLCGRLWAWARSRFAASRPSA
ncbi:MAG: hypothetical protein IPK07_26160 [Deltaproteobacteria bacterium]|nr:hypothetical protein [Deltaproteobacteria bacterium]